jgi:hypothetical protein
MVGEDFDAYAASRKFVRKRRHQRFDAANIWTKTLGGYRNHRQRQLGLELDATHGCEAPLKRNRRLGSSLEGSASSSQVRFLFFPRRIIINVDVEFVY